MLPRYMPGGSVDEGLPGIWRPFSVIQVKRRMRKTVYQLLSCAEAQGRKHSLLSVAD